MDTPRKARNGCSRPAINHLGCRPVLFLRDWLFNGIQTMSTADMAELAGWLVAAWSIGFTSGYLMTKFKHAVNQTV